MRGLSFAPIPDAGLRATENRHGRVDPLMPFASG
jgi:hypothetical protein